MHTTACTMPDDDLPLDVQYNKVVQWLLDRKKCVADWQPRAKKIRSKIEAGTQSCYTPSCLARTTVSSLPKHLSCALHVQL